MRKALLTVLLWGTFAFAFIMPVAGEEMDAGPDAAGTEISKEIGQDTPDVTGTGLEDTADPAQNQDGGENAVPTKPDTMNDAAPGAMKAKPQERADRSDIYVSASGSDDSGDGTEANPYATIQKAHNNSAVGGAVILLSNIDQTQSVSVSKSLTIASKGGPYTVKRASAFNGPMFALQALGEAVELVFENIVLDDNFTKANGNDGVISVRSGTAVLGNKATIKNYGGSSGVRVAGAGSKFVMKNGSLITTGGKTVKAQAAVWNESGTFTMEKGAVIDKVTDSGNGGVALLNRYGNNYIDGTVSNCKGAGDYAVINLAGGTNEIGPNAKIFGNTTKHGTIYVIAGAKLIVKGEIYNNTTDAADTWCSGIYAADNGAPAHVYIEDGAYIHHNTAYVGALSPYTSAVNANNTSYITMNGGRIVDNSTRCGVMVRKNGHFTMNGGEISGQTTGIKVENLLASENGKCRVLLLGGKISNSDSDICISRGTNGYMEGSFAYLNSIMTAQGLKVNYEQVKTTTFFGIRFDYSITLQTITTDESMSEVYLGNASSSGNAAIGAVPEVAAGKLITTWFAASKDDVFKLIVTGLESVAGDVFACIVPVDENGNAMEGYKIFLCGKTVNRSDMTIDVRARGTGNAAGYAIGLFANPEEPVPETYTLRYETSGGTSYPDRTGLSFTDTDLAPEKDPVRSGYIFKGWYMDAGLSRKYESTNSYADIVENETTALTAALYAAWEKIPLPVEPAKIEPIVMPTAAKSDVKDDFKAPAPAKANRAVTNGTATGDEKGSSMRIVLLLALMVILAMTVYRRYCNLRQTNE